MLDAGLPLGIGGIGRLGDTSVPVAPDLVYAQHARLGASAALIARSFLAPGIDLAAEVRRTRERLAYWRTCEPAEIDAATAALRSCT